VLKVYGKGAPFALIRPEFFADRQAKPVAAKPAAAKPAAAKPAIAASMRVQEMMAPEPHFDAIGKHMRSLISNPLSHFVPLFILRA
jgi:hypothetical protein